MALYGVEKCHFIIYEVENNTCVVIYFSKDEKFADDLIKTLSTCYFTYILPWLVANEKNNKENVTKA